MVLRPPPTTSRTPKKSKESRWRPYTQSLTRSLQETLCIALHLRRRCLRRYLRCAHRLPPPPPPTGFFRDTNKTILYVTTEGAKDVTKDNIKHAVSVLALEANIGEEDYEIIGENLGPKFEVSFTGTFSGAAAKANQFLLSLRRGPGDFKTQEVVTPAGPKVNFYVNPVKNGATIRMEILSKQLLGVIRELCPQKQFFLRRNEGTIFVDRRPLVRVLVESQESSVLSWKHQKRVAINLDDGAVESKFRDFQKEPGGGEPWS